MFAESDQGQMDMDSGAVLPTDPIRAETCFNNFVPFFTTPDADASTSGAFRAFVFPDASPNFEVGSTKEFGFSINASDMVSWPNSFLQFSTSLSIGDGKSSPEWLGRLRGMGVKVMPDLKMIFDKIDLLINESPFQTITEFPRVNFVRSNILGGSQQWIKIVQGGSYISSPELKTNAIEMGSGTSSHKILELASCSKNYAAGINLQTANGDILRPNPVIAADLDVAANLQGKVTYSTQNNEKYNQFSCSAAGPALQNFARVCNPLTQFDFPDTLLGEVTAQAPGEKPQCRNETENGSSFVLAPDEDMDLIDVLERGESIIVQIPLRDLFSSLSSIQWMPGAIFRRIQFRFHIKSNPGEFLLGYLQNSVLSTAAQGAPAVSVISESSVGVDTFYSQVIRPRIEDIHFKFENAKMYFWGQRFSPALITELKAYLDSKGSMQAVWYQAYMYYRVLRVLHNSGNVIDQNFTTISPGSAWLLSDPWYENTNAYRQKQRILIPSVVHTKVRSTRLHTNTGGATLSLVKEPNLVNAISTFSSFIPISPIANKLIQRSYVAINGREFPPTYEEQHWRLLNQPKTVHATLGFQIHNSMNQSGHYIPVTGYRGHSLLGSVYGRRSTSGLLSSYVYYPPYFEKPEWKLFDSLNMIATGTVYANVADRIAANSTGDYFEGHNFNDNAKNKLAFGRNFFYNDSDQLACQPVRLEENYLRYLMTTGFHIDPFQSQSTLIGYEQWNTIWPIISFPIGSQDSATGAPLYEATAMTGRLHLEKESDSVGVSLPYYLIIQEAYLSAITADGSIITMIGTA